MEDAFRSYSGESVQHLIGEWSIRPGQIISLSILTIENRPLSSSGSMREKENADAIMSQAVHSPRRTRQHDDNVSDASAAATELVHRSRKKMATILRSPASDEVDHNDSTWL